MVDYTDPRWNEADSLNTEPSPNGIPLGSAPSAIPAVIRAGMGAQKRRFVRDGYFAAVTNTGNDYSLTYDVAPTDYVRGENFGFFVVTTNTGPATLSINGLPAKALVSSDNVALKAGDLVAGAPVQVVYDGTRFRMVTAITTPTSLNTFIGTTNTALATKAPLASPALTGTPTVPTAAVGTNTTQAASTAFVKAAIDPVKAELTADLDAYKSHTHPISAVVGLQDALDLKATVASLATVVPSGAVMPFARNSAPTGWLEADGAAVSRTTYAALFAAIGTTFGAGNGSTTFNLPDLRGEFVRGWDDGRGVDAGRAFGSAQLDQMQRITGNAGIRAATSGVASGAMSVASTSAFTRHNGGDGGASYVYFDSAGSPGARVSSSTSGETRARNVALLYCIKV